jgi:simple sugar transport system ATP-binding protein
MTSPPPRPPRLRAAPSPRSQSVPLRALQLTKRFGSISALCDVSIDVESGRVTCLLGDNGAGKSTLIRILSGVYPPSSGTLEIDGETVELRSPRDARALGIATVHQDLALAPLMSVWRNFVLGAEPTRGRGPIRRLDVGAAMETTARQLGDMGIALDDVTRPLATLSGGQRQAVAIARAVHFGARVLILDEPTAALGVNQAARVLETIRRARDRGVAVLLVTHNPVHALQVGDRFVILRQGGVAGRWTAGDVKEDLLVTAMRGEPFQRPM